VYIDTYTTQRLRSLASNGNFLIVVELIIKKGKGKGRERKGKGGEKKGERKRKKGRGEGQTPKNVEIA
jgi:hypothetical protein